MLDAALSQDVARGQPRLARSDHDHLVREPSLRPRADLVEQRRAGYDNAVDELTVESALVDGFLSETRSILARDPAPVEACEAIRPHFAELLAADGWLPAQFQEPAAESGMGGGIGQWLLFRAENRSLSLFSLVVPPGAQTPIHDHLAWGLVGLYRGTQDEEIYALDDGAFALAERRALAPGDFYALIPPTDDIHRIRTTSPGSSVSIHLLTNDTGCIWRHAYDPQTGEATPFRSGYVNVDCA
jgi:predicted metal-dependent enzyme (double-stranded beta helix superfamily)